MATTAEQRFTCSDCGKPGADRQNEINYLYTVRRGGHIWWLCRCKSCFWKAKRETGNDTRAETEMGDSGENC